MDITKTSLPEWNVGNGTVGDGAEVMVTEVGLHCYAGVRIKADVDNTGVLYVGKTGVGASSGYVLKAGESELFTIEDSGDLYVIASAADQLYSFFQQ